MAFSWCWWLPVTVLARVSGRNNDPDIVPYVHRKCYLTILLPMGQTKDFLPLFVYCEASERFDGMLGKAELRYCVVYKVRRAARTL